MAGKSVNGSGNGARAGAPALLLLATPLSVSTLRALADGALPQVDLRRALGSPAQTTLRAQLKKFTEFGLIGRQRRSRFPSAMTVELTPAGQEMIEVVDVLEAWLEAGPVERMALSDRRAKPTIRALAEAWSTTILRAIAAGPRSLTELDRLIAGINYPALERRLVALRAAGLVRIAQDSSERGVPYAVTEWLRQSVGPLAAAARWEARHREGRVAPLGPLDMEAMFLLAVPLVELPQDISGSCRLTAEIPAPPQSRLVGVDVVVENGRIASCSTLLDGAPGAWASGSKSAWLDAIVTGDAGCIEVGGNGAFTRSLLAQLHTATLSRIGEKTQAGLTPEV